MPPQVEEPVPALEGWVWAPVADDEGAAAPDGEGSEDPPEEDREEGTVPVGGVVPGAVGVVEPVGPGGLVASCDVREVDGVGDVSRVAVGLGVVRDRCGTGRTCWLPTGTVSTGAGRTRT
jgi:hypothetical protein